MEIQLNEKKQNTFRDRWIGDRAFYKKVGIVLFPIMIQMGITNLVNLLDNIMVGRLGTEPLSGVAIINQLIFIYNLMIFGILAAASIYGAQFVGKGDHDGYHQTIRFRMICGLAIGILGWLAFAFAGDFFIRLYLGGDTEVTTMMYAGRYLSMICWQLIPFALVQGLGGALKDSGETGLPMQASVLAILSNLVLNYLLIYGKLGLPAMGVEGAALATVIARYLEMAFLICRIRQKWEELPFLHGAFTSLYVSRTTVKRIVITGTPLFLNETFWSSGLAVIGACYASRGIPAVAATNINQTVWNLFGIACLAMGNAIGILVGQRLGAGDYEGAKASARKMILMTVVMNVAIGIVIVLAAPFIPYVYKTEPEVRSLATQLLRICGFMMPVSAFTNASYFILRSGGKTIITFCFDSVFTWFACIPMAWCLCHYTSLGVVAVYFAVQSLEFVKMIIGSILMKSGIWIQRII